MRTTNTMIIGGGQAGLALSHCLTTLGRDHLVLERGRVAERWRSARWDSLRLLTPNWMTRLPGYSYDGPDQDGFMTAGEVVGFFEDYAESFDAPVRDSTAVRRVAPCGDLFVIETDDGPFLARNVVIATGWCDQDAVPAMATNISSRINQVVPSRYRNPDDLPAGGVLVVGASATGVQLAQELHLSGRPVTLAIGTHSRMPRTYRGMDSYWWLELLGALDRTIDDVGDPLAARREPSLQLVGSPEGSTLDLATLQTIGVRLVGRLQAIDGGRATFAPNLNAIVADTDRRMHRVLDRVDDAVERLSLSAEMLAPDRPGRVAPVSPIASLDLHAAGITSVVWATGYRRRYDWIELPILDQHGEIVQYRGVTPTPGVYVLGQRFQHYRSSNFIDGVGRDALAVAEHITATPARRELLASASTSNSRHT
ncbi:MAG TPA: NAD(P)-binding domain-containing protein [Ilumatobacter sp.]|nr:NAD(P)-binding domain-containing protein [Ilumatobacter sp.]